MFAKNKTLKIILIIIGALALILAIYFIPAVKRRVDWKVYQIRAGIFYFFNPPGQDPFTPSQQNELDKIVQMTQTAMSITATATVDPTVTPTNYMTPTSTQTASPTPSPTHIPKEVRLDGVDYEYQGFNNCGPANLSMALSYWDWEGDQYDIANVVKPHTNDRNVMPYEMVEYVEKYTDLSILVRYGGDLEMIKKLIAAGFPVILEKGLEVVDKGWMGHYTVATGYDDVEEELIFQDSYVGDGQDMPYSYARTLEYWKDFNYIYLVIYRPDRQKEIESILGPHIDENYNLRFTVEKAMQDIETMQGNDMFFALYNYGSTLVLLQDYYGAAQAYDNAYAMFEGFNPYWRITWYRTEPYFAYYFTERYRDVLDLASITISYVSNDAAIEESHVWHGRANLKLGNVDEAIEDFRTALEWHPGWWVAENELQLLGVEP